MKPTCFTVEFEFSDGESLKLLHSAAIWTPEDALESTKKMSVCREKSEKGISIKDINIHYYYTLKEALQS